MSTRRTRRRGEVARAFCSAVALDLRLEDVGPDDLVAALGISERHAVAVLDGHPSAFLMNIVPTLCDMAGLDLVTTLRAVEQQQRGESA